MLPAPTSTLERVKQQEFLKAKIKEAFTIVGIMGSAVGSGGGGAGGGANGDQTINKGIVDKR